MTPDELKAKAVDAARRLTDAASGGSLLWFEISIAVDGGRTY